MKWLNQFEGDSLTFPFMLRQMLSGRSTKRRIEIEPPEKRRRWDEENT
jgi:hypothetical protein